MSSPHPVLLGVATGEETPPIPDEAEFLRSALEHRMAAEVLGAVEEGRLELSPATSISLGAAILAERRRHDGYWQAIADVENRLASLGAQVAVMKGVATESRWYDAPGHRVCTDVDLLLDPAALGMVDEVIAVLTVERARTALQPLVDRHLLQHVDLRLGTIPVDLHFDPLKAGLRTRQIEEVWASTTRLAVDHGAVRVLSPEVELVLLLLHLNKDGFAYLGSLLDIRQLVTRAALDWDRLRSFVSAEGLDVPVWRSLALIDELLGLGLDPSGLGPSGGGWRTKTWDLIWKRAVLGGHEARERAPGRQRLMPMHFTGRNREVVRELRRQILPHRHLVELAGRMDPHESYVGYIFDRLRRRA